MTEFECVMPAGLQSASFWRPLLARSRAPKPRVGELLIGLLIAGTFCVVLFVPAVVFLVAGVVEPIVAQVRGVLATFTSLASGSGGHGVDVVELVFGFLRAVVGDALRFVGFAFLLMPYVAFAGLTTGLVKCVRFREHPQLATKVVVAENPRQVRLALLAAQSWVSGLLQIALYETFFRPLLSIGRWFGVRHLPPAFGKTGFDVSYYPRGGVLLLTPDGVCLLGGPLAAPIYAGEMAGHFVLAPVFPSEGNLALAVLRREEGEVVLAKLTATRQIVEPLESLGSPPAPATAESP